MLNLYSLTKAELAQQLADWGFPAVHAGTVWANLYRHCVASPAEFTGLPARLAARLQTEACLSVPQLARQTVADDGHTHKYLLQLADRGQIETVQMHIRGRSTACLSSQVGCALGCVFCATGQMGFDRNLTTAEIVSQALFVQRRLLPQGERLRNLVLMGMGEPLLNYDAVMTALDIVCDQGGLSISPKRVTISTVGVVPGIVRLADQRRGYSLAVSLHASTPAERLRLIPAARTWPLDALIDACRYYVRQTEQKIFFEWTFIRGQNDSAEQAGELARLLQDLPAHVNLIPLNASPGYVGEPGELESLTRFQSLLRQQGIPSTVRQRRGTDIAAGCGQLAAETH
jgi:23S rRNA (adenine2503-C2)-methyltransferase